MITVDVMRTLAYMQHQGDDYFIYEGVAYEGTLEDAQEDYENAQSDVGVTFSDYLKECCLEVSEWDNDAEDCLILTDEEADEEAKRIILESVWAFNPSFLDAHIKSGKRLDKMIAKLQKDNSENCNDMLLAMIDDKQHFVDDAICADGRGHFIATYDGNENEETVKIEGQEAITFYLYQIS